MSQTAIELLVAFTQLVFFIQMCSAPKVGIPVVGLVSSVGLGVQNLQSTRIQSTHPPWVVYTGGGWGFFFSIKLPLLGAS
jgi:hypothetical protein